MQSFSCNAKLCFVNIERPQTRSRLGQLLYVMLSEATFVHSVWHFGCNQDTKTKQWQRVGQSGRSEFMSTALWHCLLTMSICLSTIQPLLHKQQILGRFPRKQTWPAVECCSSSAVDLRFCWSVPRSGAVSGWSLLLFCQKATKERTEEKTARLHPSQVAYIYGRSSVRGTQHREWLCNEKAIAVLAECHSEILEGCYKLFPKRWFCWKHLCSLSSLSPYFSTDSLTLFFVLLLLNLSTTQCLRFLLFRLKI